MVANSSFSNSAFANAAIASSALGDNLSDISPKQKKRAAVSVDPELSALVFLTRKEPSGNSVQVIHHPNEDMLRREGVFQWHLWAREPSEFFWTFTEAENLYILEGEVYLTPEGSDETVVARQGDFVKFAQGLRCHWRVTKPFRKHVSLQRNTVARLTWKLIFALRAIPRAVSGLF